MTLFSKGLSHNPLTGLPFEGAEYGEPPYTQQDVQDWPSEASAIEPLMSGAPEFEMPPPMTPFGKQMSAEVIELIWMVLLRNEPFSTMGRNTLTGEAARELERVNIGDVSRETLFRAGIEGVEHGQFVSKFFLANVQHGWVSMPQAVPTMRRPKPHGYGANMGRAASIQMGMVPEFVGPLREREAICNSPSSMSTLVHKDYAPQLCLQTALVLYGHGVPSIAAKPDEAFIYHSLNDFAYMSSLLAQKALEEGFRQKWAYRQLRPEEFCIRAELQRSQGMDFGIPDMFYNSVAVKTLIQEQGNCLLPLAYPEGSPMHPSYPAAHATVAGACATLAKRWFEDGPWPGTSPREGVTIHGEINKMAYNISVARSFAGVHYRNDNIEGLKLGEQVALELPIQEGTRSAVAHSWKTFAGVEMIGAQKAPSDG